MADQILDEPNFLSFDEWRKRNVEILNEICTDWCEDTDCENQSKPRGLHVICPKQNRQAKDDYERYKKEDLRKWNEYQKSMINSSLENGLVV